MLKIVTLVKDKRKKNVWKHKWNKEQKTKLMIFIHWNWNNKKKIKERKKDNFESLIKFMDFWGW